MFIILYNFEMENICRGRIMQWHTINIVKCSFPCIVVTHSLISKLWSLILGDII